MLTAKKIHSLFSALDNELLRMGVKGEVGICGGAVMCLVFNARRSTKDIDAIFEPASEIRRAAKVVQKKYGLAADWLNDAAKAFFMENPPQINVLELSNLRVWAPSPEYMLAMKCVSARFDTHDKNDVIFLLKHLDLKSPQRVFDIIQQYYPKKLISPKTQFLVGELLEDKNER